MFGILYLLHLLTTMKCGCPKLPPIHLKKELKPTKQLMHINMNGKLLN